MVDGPKVQAVVCGSTNFTWRGFFVQSNNAIVLRGKTAVKPFLAAFDDYWQNDTAAGFGKTASAKWTDLKLSGIDAHVAFSPHSSQNALLAKIAADIGENITSSLFYSLAFLYQTPGPIRDAIEKVTKSDDIFVYGISDRKVGGGLDLQSVLLFVGTICIRWEPTRTMPLPPSPNMQQAICGCTPIALSKTRTWTNG